MCPGDEKKELNAASEDSVQIFKAKGDPRRRADVSKVESRERGNRQQDGRRPQKIETVIMGGGAPTSPLMAGFLYGILESGRDFKQFHTSGTGALMALLSISSKHDSAVRKVIQNEYKKPEDQNRAARLLALRSWVEVEISDEIYSLFPINYKLFRKPGPFTPLYQDLASRFKLSIKNLASLERSDTQNDPNTQKPRQDDFLRKNKSGKYEYYKAMESWVHRGRKSEEPNLFESVDMEKFKKELDKFNDSLKKDDERRIKSIKKQQGLDEKIRVVKDKRHGHTGLTAQLLADILVNLNVSPKSGLVNQDAIERTRTRLLSMWVDDEKNVKGKVEKLAENKDPIRRIRDNWLGTWLKTDHQKRIYNDMVDLWFAALSPSTLSPKSKGLAEPLPFLEDFVDFKGLKKNLGPGRNLYVNAYNLDIEAESSVERMSSLRTTERSMENFRQSGEEDWALMKISADRIPAAFSLPFIFPPTAIRRSMMVTHASYFEGAYQEPINLTRLKKKPHEFKDQVIVVLDAMGILEDYIVKPLKDLWEVYVIFIFTPVVKLAKRSLGDLYEQSKSEKWKEIWNINILWIDWRIPREAQPYVME